MILSIVARIGNIDRGVRNEQETSDLNCFARVSAVLHESATSLAGADKEKNQIQIKRSHYWRIRQYGLVSIKRLQQ